MRSMMGSAVPKALRFDDDPARAPGKIGKTVKVPLISQPRSEVSPSARVPTMRDHRLIDPAFDGC